MTSTILILAGILNAASAFAPTNPNRAQHSRQPRGASIYYPDDNGGCSYYEHGYEASSSTSDDIFSFASAWESTFFGQLANQLSSDPTNTHTLAKIASAFSPPGFAIDLSHVNNVRCHSVDNRHMEIEAVVCDDFECSSLLIPVDFPEMCDVNDTDLSGCILRNMSILDGTGQHVLQERDHVFAQEEEAQLAFEVLQSLDSEYLKSSTPFGLPAWWGPPLSKEDETECDLIQDLLNHDEDLRDMMRGLAEQGLLFDADLSSELIGRSIQNVQVQAVGQEGMVLKVQLSLSGKTGYDEGGLNNERVLDVPVKFDDVCPAAVTHGSVRDKVLAAVESVNA